MRQALFCGLLPIWLCACEAFPQLDAAITEEAENAEYLRLLPTSQLQTYGDSGHEIASEHSGRQTEWDYDDLAARAQRLRARGDFLRQLARDEG